MRLVARSTAIAVLAIIAAVLLAVTTTMTSIALAATALIMGGTGHPLSRPQDTQAYIQNYVNGADSNYIAPSGLCNGGSAGSCNKVFAVYTPEQFRFDTGLFDMTFDKSVAQGKVNLDSCIRSGSCLATASPFTTTLTQPVSDTDLTYVVYGYSQSATVATLEKRDLLANPEPGTTVNFVLAANPNRPNGGILERFKGLYIPILGVSFNGATPTNNPDGTPTDMTTVDIVRQYDGWADFPTNPLNLLADLNAAMGIALLHGNYYGVGTPELQGQYGDTTYYMIPTPVLPLLMPLDKIPLIGHPLAVTLDPFFRVLVEAGYDRTINPGQPTTAKWLYIPNPITLVGNLIAAIPTGLDNGISAITGNPATRPFGTTPPGPYGVGGPDVYAGCGGNASCIPTPYVVVDSAPQIAAAKLATQPSAPDPKQSKGPVATADSGLTVSQDAGNQQQTTDASDADNVDLGSKDPRPKPKPKPFKPFQVKPPSATADEQKTPTVGTPASPRLQIKDVIDPPRRNKPANPNGDAPSQTSASGAASAAGATGQAS